jgi:hypothetical protein
MAESQGDPQLGKINSAGELVRRLWDRCSSITQRCVNFTALLGCSCLCLATGSSRPTGFHLLRVCGAATRRAPVALIPRRINQTHPERYACAQGFFQPFPDFVLGQTKASAASRLSEAPPGCALGAASVDGCARLKRVADV